MEKDKSFTPEQMSDAEHLLNELAKIPENKRPFIVAVITAYMNGIEAGSTYTQVAD